ncbi:hypothetical protein FPOAC2_12277 [Fusarium poae]|uniref:Uncharacterized protein n=1 Tax=Fusarium poae TaxID=36050 RepID=A0A1B8AFW9_FUSPO|nr:hypothetical protein FPOAC1_011946 [Fusarium poae]KAG8667124.1 hypothetical protein FPOAC1_011946 [Fusarium poae]OBS19361.1 hypothetical protein FPOA_11086 [Fusarium poae]
MSCSRYNSFETSPSPGLARVNCASPWTETEEPDNNIDLGSCGAFFKAKLTLDLILADLDYESLQDAIAIVSFPLNDEGPRFSKMIVPNLMDKWEAYEIGNGFIGTRIGKLYYCVRKYIHDYMLKATSSYLPRAYCGLPLLSDDCTSFKHETLQSEFDLGSFGVVGRRRLFWAFLRYELMSRIRFYKATVDSSYTPPPRLSQRYGRPFLSWEDEAIRCVQTYVSSLYAAHFAQWHGIQLPADRRATDRYPFQRMDWIMFQAKKWSLPGQLMGRLEEYGFRFVTDLINDAKKATEDQKGPEWLHNLLCKLKDLDQGELDDVHKPRVTTIWEDFKNGRRVPDLCARTIWQDNRPTSEAWECYRQRAWVFFDEARLHPQHSVLVDLPEIPTSTDHSDTDHSDSEVGHVISESTRIPRSLYDDTDSWYNM